MKILTIIVRVLLGLIFLAFGINGFWPFIPMPPLKGALALQFLGALASSGYLSAIFALQILGGLLTLAGWVPLGLTILCPILVNITLFHALMDPGQMLHAIVPDLLALFLIWRYWGNFAGLFRTHA